MDNTQEHRPRNLEDNKELECESLREKFYKLQEEHRKLLAVTAELTSALQLNIVGQTRNLQNVLDQCNTLYPTLFVPTDIHNQKDVRVRCSDKAKGTNNSIRDEYFAENKASKSESQKNNEPLPKMEPLDLGNVHCENVEETQPMTPITEREIKDIVDIILNKAVRFLTSGDMNVEASDCCELGKACASCKNDIFKIVESILVKVMESPRFKTSSRYTSTANSSKINLEPTYYHVEAPSDSSNQDRNNSKSKSWQTHYENHNSDLPNVDEVNLNYTIVKDDLLKGNNEERINILRALRRNLTKSERNDAKKTLKDYIQHDILNTSDKHLLTEALLQTESVTVHEQVFRLLNTIASFRKGRDYLASNDKLLKSVLVPNFMKNSTVLAVDMLAGTLQKLSLQRHMRIPMVMEGLLDFLVEFLDVHFQKLSPYCLEHCIALFMNLCLEDEAKIYCATNSTKVVNLMKKLLENRDTSYVPYINGTLLNLLALENVSLEAKRQSLDKVMHQLTKEISDEYVRRQLSYIIQVRFSQQLECFVGDDGEFPAKDDLLERELDTDTEQEVTLNDHGNTDAPPLKKSISPSEAPHYQSSVEIFEGKPNKKPIKPHLVTGSGKKKRILRRVQNFPKASFCYLEICHEVHDGSRSCRCIKCTPGKNRYTCGCYDMICKEITEEIDNICKGQGINMTKYIKKTYKGGTVEVTGSQQHSVGTQCAICGDRICECAFESRPKIHRTPPRT